MKFTELYVLFDLITIAVTIVLSIRNVKNIGRGSRYIIYYVLVCFYILPLLLDYLVAFPDYQYDRVRFSYGEYDSTSRLIYDAFMLYIQFIILYYKKNYEPKVRYECRISENKIESLYWCGMLLPIGIALLFSMPNFLFFTPMWREMGLNLRIFNFIYVEKTDFIAISCSILMLFSGKYQSKKNLLQKFLIIVFLYICICLEGKRSIFLYTILNIVVVMLPGIRNKNFLQKIGTKQIIIIFTVIVSISYFIVLLSYNVMDIRDVDDDFSVQYTLQRIDYFRDDRVRLAIFSLLHPNEIKLVNYPCETILPMVSWLWPINLIFQYFHIYQPRFSTNLSNALVGNNLSMIDDEVNFMTPDFLSELIANMGALGMITAPFLCLYVAKLIDRYPYPINAIIVVSFVGLVMYSPAYVGFVIEFAIILMFFHKRINV